MEWQLARESDRNPPSLHPGLLPGTEAHAGPGVTTESLAAIAAACAQGRADLQAADAQPEALRLFSIWEITRYLIPVGPAHFRRVLRENPDLPQGRLQGRPGTSSGSAAGDGTGGEAGGGETGGETGGGETGAKWFSLAEVQRLRRFFAGAGSPARAYLPYRPAGLPAKTVAVANARSATGKTTLCAHLAVSAALDGYRVLMIDLDGQGALTRSFGARVADQWQTVYPLFARHLALHLQAENRARLARGEGPVALEDPLPEALKIRAGDLVRATRWPGVDLIGAQLDLLRADLQIPAWRMTGRSWKPWEALAGMLAADGLLDRYDLVFFDTPPSLGPLSLAAIAAADVVLVPLAASAEGLDAAGRFLGLLHTTFAGIEAEENRAARALGRDETVFRWDAIRTVPTRYDAAGQARAAGVMQVRLGEVMPPWRQEVTPLIAARSCVYDVDYREVGREIWIRARESFDDSYAGFRQLLTALWAQDARRQP